MKKIIPILLIGFFATFIFLEVVYGYGFSKYAAQREQPIAFNHRLHAGKQNIKCTTCHLYPEKSAQAGAPFLSTCMECHQKLQLKSVELDKLFAHWQEKKPVEWARIYRLPDFIYFSHKRHVKAGIDCAECHGQVAWMDTMRRVSTMKMGWCVSCHTAKNGPKDCWTCHK